MDWQSFLVGVAVVPLCVALLVVLYDVRYVPSDKHPLAEENAKLRAYIVDVERYRDEAKAYMASAEKYLQCARLENLENDSPQPESEAERTQLN